MEHPTAEVEEDEDLSNHEITDVLLAAKEEVDEVFEEKIGRDVSSFTQITMWDDGDFRIMRWHGMGLDAPRTQEAKLVEFKLEQGVVEYAHVRRHRDHHMREFVEQETVKSFPS